MTPGEKGLCSDCDHGMNVHAPLNLEATAWVCGHYDPATRSGCVCSPSRKPAAALALREARCMYVFDGTTNPCGSPPDHPVHVGGEWNGPEEYHFFIERSAGAAPLDVECDCGCHLCDCYLRHAEWTNR